MPADGDPGFRATAAPAIAVRRVVAFAHVADVEESLAFYAHLGFSAERVMRDRAGRAFWALASTARVGGADSGREAAGEIMFALADSPVDPTVQAVLFYMYAPDVSSLRGHLLASGLHDGGRFVGQPGPNGGRCVAFAISRPDHMRCGELRVADPDGYCILVGQLDREE